MRRTARMAHYVAKWTWNNCIQTNVTQLQVKWRTEHKLERVGDGEGKQIAVGSRVHVRVADDDDARHHVSNHPGQFHTHRPALGHPPPPRSVGWARRRRSATPTRRHCGSGSRGVVEDTRRCRTRRLCRWCCQSLTSTSMLSLSPSSSSHHLPPWWSSSLNSITHCRRTPNYSTHQWLQ